MYRRIWILMLPLAFAFSGCISYYHIQTQEDPGLSLAIFELRVPYTLQEVSLQEKSGDVYQSHYRARFSDTIRNNIVVIENLRGGDYFIKHILSTTEGTTTNMGGYTRTTWSEFRVDGDDPGTGYFEIPVGRIVYLGRVVMIAEDKLESVLAELGKKTGRPADVVKKAILHRTKLVGKKGTFPVVLIRTDHPLLIGEKAALNSEREILRLAILKDRQPDDIPAWQNLARKRVDEITAQIGP